MRLSTKKVRAIWWPRWWRNPIQRWRMRHLLRDVRKLQAELDRTLTPEGRQWFSELQERAFLFGGGHTYLFEDERGESVD